MATATKKAGKRIKTEAIQWRPVEPDGLEGTTTKYDFVISNEDAGVVLDVFQAGEPNHDEAHVDSIWRGTIEEAKQTAASYR